MTSMMAPPAAPSGFFWQKRASAVHAPGRLRRAGSAAVASTSEALAAIAHAGVEDAVQHVDDQVREDDDDRDEHDQVLDDRIVPPQDRLHEEARQARQVEDGLGDDESADQEREFDADHRDHRQDRVLERMTPAHYPH